MDEAFWIAGPLIGFIGMMSGGFWGVGCGWIVVPTMLILGMTPLEAVGIGLLQMVPSTLLTVVKQAPEIGWKRHSPGITLALPIGIGAMLTSFLGKWVNRELLELFGSARPLQWLLIGFISLIAFQTLISRTPCYADTLPEITPRKSFIAFIMGLLTGVVSSMLGVGGGILIRPLLTSGFRLPEYYTSRIVRALVLVTTVTGGITYLVGQGGFESRIFGIAMLTAAGGIFGFPLGVKMHKIVYDAGCAQHIHKSFAVIAIAVPLNTLLNMYGYSHLSRCLMIGIAVVLACGLSLFTLYVRKYPSAGAITGQRKLR